MNNLDAEALNFNILTLVIRYKATYQK